MSLPSNPFAFKSAALESSLPQTKVQIDHSGSTTTTTNNINSSTSPTTTSTTSAAAMFEAFANQSKLQQPTQSTIPTFTVDTTNIDKSANAFRSTDDDNHNEDSFDVFKSAQEQIDQNTFESAFTSLDFTTQRQELEQLKKQHLQEQLEHPNQSNSGDLDWLLMLNAIEEEVAKVEKAVQQQEELEVQNAIAMIGQAIQDKTTISLPSQSAESRALTEHVAKLYAEFSQKQKTKEYKKQMRTQNGGPLGQQTKQQQGKFGSSAKDQLSKNKKAATKALDRFNRLDELSVQDRNNQKRRQGNGQIDFLNDDAGPYKKQSQANKKKNKKLGW